MTLKQPRYRPLPLLSLCLEGAAQQEIVLGCWGKREERAVEEISPDFAYIEGSEETHFVKPVKISTPLLIKGHFFHYHYMYVALVLLFYP